MPTVISGPKLPPYVMPGRGSSMSFVFYDTETTGTNTSFDQILQFAAIRTDDDLKEIDRFEIRCSLDAHVVPSAGAFRVTGMTIGNVTAAGLPTHYEMVCQLRAQLEKWCPTTFVGWNTLSFDENLLRQAFYKCLHPPYLTNTKGNQRSDILKLAQCVEAYAEDVLVVPLNEKGKPTYKLDRLAPANGFKDMNAHDAMGDVEATIFICRLIKDRAPDAWDHMLHCAAKARVESVINDSPIFLLRDYYGALKEYPLTRLGDEPNGFATLAYDLSIEPSQLSVLDDVQLAARLKKTPKPVRRIRSNVAPFVIPVVDGETVGAFSYNSLLERRNELFAQPSLIERMSSLSAREASVGSEHIEEQIYDGFPSPADSARMVRFHALPWCERYGLVEEFSDARYRTLGRRLIYAHCPESLPDSVRQDEKRLVAARLTGHGFDGAPWSTLDQAAAEAAQFEGEGDGSLAAMLAEFGEFVAVRKRWAKDTLAGKPEGSEGERHQHL